MYGAHNRINTRTLTITRTHAHTHARTHARTRTHTQTVQTNRDEEQCFLTNIFGEKKYLQFAFEERERERVAECFDLGGESSRRG